MKTRVLVPFILTVGLALLLTWGVGALELEYRQPSGEKPADGEQMGSSQAETDDAPGWQMVNSDGFGDATNWAVGAMEVFQNQLYAGTWNVTCSQIWRLVDDTTWEQSIPGWSAIMSETFDLQTFGDHLYVGLGVDAPGIGGEIWRTDGATWQQVASGGFGDPNNEGVNTFAVFADALYATTANPETGVEVWRSTTGGPGTWTQVNDDGFGSGGTWYDVVMDVYKDHLYLGLGREATAELWRSGDGLTWTPVFTVGLGDADNTHVSSMAEFGGTLYIGLRNSTEGGEVWHSSDGLGWTQVFADGLGNPDNNKPYGLIVAGDLLYLVFSNTFSGAEVWRTASGDGWQRINESGWGDMLNGFADYFDKGAAVFPYDLYISTMNDAGGEVWRFSLAERIYLPLVMREFP